MKKQTNKQTNKLYGEELFLKS